MKRPPEPLQTAEAKELVRCARAGRKKATAIRDAAAVAVMWRSHLRISELLGLRFEDYETDRLRVLHGKGAKHRVVGCDEGTQALINAWVVVRPESEYLFCTMKGTAVDASHYRRLMKRLQNSAEIVKRCHPHGMRHTGAMELAKERVPLPFIAAQLGHSNVSTTDEYLRHISGQEIVDVVSKRQW